MAYVDPNYKTKKALIEAVKKGITVDVYQPGGLGVIPQNGRISLEGPHYPEPHKWYASGTMENGKLVAVK